MPDQYNANLRRRIRGLRLLKTDAPRASLVYFPPIPPCVYLRSEEEIAKFVAGATRWQVIAPSADGFSLVCRVERTQ